MKRPKGIEVDVTRSLVSQLPKALQKKITYKYFFSLRGKTVVLDPIEEKMSADEKWFYAPENKEVLKSIQRGLKQKGGKFYDWSEVKKRKPKNK